MAIFAITDVTPLLQALADNGAAHRLRTACDPRTALYPLLSMRAALDGGHHCSRSCACPLITL